MQGTKILQSILNYFRKKGNGRGESQIDNKSTEYYWYRIVIEKIFRSHKRNSVASESSPNRVTYKKEDKLLIARYVSMHGQSRAVVKYLGQSQKLSESIARGKAVDLLPPTIAARPQPF